MGSGTVPTNLCKEKPIIPNLAPLNHPTLPVLFTLLLLPPRLHPSTKIMWVVVRSQPIFARKNLSSQTFPPKSPKLASFVYSVLILPPLIMWAVVPTNIWRKTPTSQTLPSQTSPAHPFLSDLLDNIDECRQESAHALEDLRSAWGKIRQAPKTWWAAPSTNLPHKRPSLPPACVHETCLTRRLPGWRIGCLSLCAWRHACARLGSCFGASGQPAQKCNLYHWW